VPTSPSSLLSTSANLQRRLHHLSICVGECSIMEVPYHPSWGPESNSGPTGGDQMRKYTLPLRGGKSLPKSNS